MEHPSQRHLVVEQKYQLILLMPFRVEVAAVVGMAEALECTQVAVAVEDQGTSAE
jgi:hypothetical protein